MRSARRRWTFIAGAGLICIVVLWLTIGGIWRHERAHPVRPSNNQETGLTFPFLHLYVFSGGSKQWTLTAINASVSPSQGLVHCDSIKDGKFYRSNEVVARFQAGPATYNRATNNLDLSGPIQVDAVNGVRLSCGSLHYAYLAHRLTAQGPLQITTPQTTFVAGRLTADLALEELTFEATPGLPVSLRSSGPPPGVSPSSQ